MIRCPECPGIHNVIPSDGPERNDYSFILEAPGPQEDRKGRMAVGKVGEEIDYGYLPLAGLRRSNVRMTNAIKCLPPGASGKLDSKNKRDMSLLESCAQCHLYPELLRLKPKLIVPMGAFACKAIDPDINLELEHGIPRMTPFGVAFPMYHPAGGIHEPKKMLTIRTDWVRFRKYITGQLHLPVDRHEGLECYVEIRNPGMVHDSLCGNWHLPFGCDTETTRQRKPFCLTYSTAPGSGFLIHADDRPSLGAFQEHLDRWQNIILWHNWLFDGKVVKMMGLRFPRKRIVDTMVRVFHLGNMPQGLKAISYRESGMQMQDFDDLVSPHSAQLVLDYYRNAFLVDWPKPDPFMYREKDGIWKIKNPQSMNTKLKRFFTDYDKNPEAKDVFDMWTDNWGDSHELMEAELGHWPGKCITHVPFDEVLFYACRDADALVRFWPLLRHMERRVRKTAAVNWRDGYVN